MATWDDVARIALALPETGERVSRDLRQWTVKDKLFVWERPLRKTDLEGAGRRARRTGRSSARASSTSGPRRRCSPRRGVFFTTPHFDGYPIVLVELDRIDVAGLDEVIVEAWLARAPQRLADAYVRGA